MIQDSLSDILNTRTVTRLRRIADEVEAGATLNDIAEKHGIPVQVLRRLSVQQRRGRPKTGPRTINEILLAKAVTRVQDGASIREIAAELQVNAKTLRDALARSGVTPHTIKTDAMAKAISCYRQGMKIDDIIGMTGISRVTLYKYLKQVEGDALRLSHKPRGLSPEELARRQQAVELYQQGIKINDIERRTGLAAAVIYRYMRSLGTFERRQKADRSIAPRGQPGQA